MSLQVETTDVPLGEQLPPGWRMSTIGELLKVRNGFAFKSTDYLEEGALLVRQSNLDGSRVSIEKAKYLPKSYLDEYSDFLIKKGDILIGMSGSIGKLCTYNRDEPALQNQRTGLLVFKDQEQKPWVWYYLPLLEKDLVKAGKGVAVLNVSASQIESFPIPIAPLDQQKRIVAEIEKQFSRLDEAVANLKRVKANLKRYKAAVLKAAVEGRLVETEAELARREGRSYETGEQLLQRILETRCSQWQGRGKYKEPAAPKTTDLKELPEGWVWVTVDSVCEQIVDCPHSTARFQSEGLPCIDTTWMTTEGLAMERARYVDDATYKERIARLEPKPGDIIFAREGTIGTAVLVPDRMTPCLGQRVMLLRPSKLYLNGLLRHVLHSETVKRQYRVQALGSTVAHINVGDVKAFKVPVPPLTEQHRIVAEVDRRLSLVRETEAQVDANLQRAERLRQSLLSRAFTGGLCPAHGRMEAAA